jgi:heterodisulfide reductase subunit C
MYDTLRYMALEGGYKPEPVIHALHKSFLDSIKLWGRVHELSMIAQYKIRSPFGSDLRADIGVALYLLLKGKLVRLPERVRGLGQVRELYKRSESDSSMEVQP